MYYFFIKGGNNMLTIEQVYELLDDGCIDVLSAPEWARSQAVQLYAIGIDPSYIRFMTNPAPQVIIKALSVNGLLLEYISIQSKQIVDIACMQNPKAESFINDTTLMVQK
jgi:hypothetical protein